MKANIYSQRTDVELALLKSIDFSCIKQAAFRGAEGLENCTVFKAQLIDGGTSVGQDNHGRYVVVNQTLEAGKTYMVDDDDIVNAVDDLPALVAVMKAMAVKNAIIKKHRSSYASDSNGICEGSAWRSLSREISLSALKGELTIAKVDALFDGMAADAQARSARERGDQLAKEYKATSEKQDWLSRSEMSCAEGRVEKNKMTIEDGSGGVVVFELQDGKLVSSVVAFPGSAASIMRGGLPVATSAMVDLLAFHKVDAEVVYTKVDGTGMIERRVSLKNRGEFPMVDYCVSKSKRPAYLAAKKLFGGCTGAQLFDYEHMSGIKAKILGMQSIGVEIYRGDRRMKLQVPLNLVVPEKGSPSIRATIGSLPAEVAPYIVFRNYLSSGLKTIKEMTGSRFVEMCGEIGYTDAQAYDTLRKLWQIEAL